MSSLLHSSDVPSTSQSSKGKRANNKTEQTNETPSPPDYILPGATERPPLATLLPTSTYPEVYRTLSLSHTLLHSRMNSSDVFCTDGIDNILHDRFPVACWICHLALGTPHLAPGNCRVTICTLVSKHWRASTMTLHHLLEGSL